MRVDTLTALIVMVGSVFLYTKTNEFPEGAEIFPRLLLVVTFALAAIILVMTLKDKKAAKILTSLKSVNWRPYVTYFAMVMYVIGITTLGFFFSTACFLVLMMFYLGIRKLYEYVLAVSSLLLFFYLLFIQFLHVPLPHGIIY